MLVLATAPCCMHVSCSSITPVLTCTLFARVLVLYRAVAWIRRVQRVNRSTGRIVRQQQRETCAHSGCDAHMPDTPHGALLLASHDAGVAVRLGWNANPLHSADFHGVDKFALQHDTPQVTRTEARMHGSVFECEWDFHEVTASVVLSYVRASRAGDELAHADRIASASHFRRF